MKYKIEFSIILLISLALAAILPGFFLGKKQIIMPGVTEFIFIALVAFVILTLAFFAYKKPR